MSHHEDARTVAPYGAWASPLSIDRLTEGVVFLSEPHGADGVRWWLEGRPEEQGRQVLIRRDRDGSITRLTPEGFNARSRVHEYGGAAVLISGDLIVVSDFATGRLHRVAAPERLAPITPDREWRFADLQHDVARNRLFAIREDHTPEVVAEHGEWVNELVSIDLTSGDVTVLAAGADFYASPRLSPDGSRLAFVRWNHPNLPWDGTELVVAGIAADGSLEPAGRIAGSSHDWITQPRWSPEGELHFVAEPENWMNLFRVRDGRVESIAPMDAEFGEPEWQFGNHTYDFLSDGSILAVGRREGRDRIYRIAVNGDVEVVDSPYTEIGALVVDGDVAVLRAAGPLEPGQIAEIDPRTEERRTLRRATPFSPSLL
jgi:dipeptidyl aminopeptidase/acylaminoacyl peptidase